MMWPNPFNPYEGGPTVIEWLKQVCDKFNELLTAVKNVRELPAGGSHGQVPTPKEDGSGYEWVDQSGGGGGGTSDLLWKPTVSTAGIISWARSSSTTAPASQNIKGTPGKDGTNGKDGVSPTAVVRQEVDGARITIIDKNGTTTAEVKNGKDGKDGSTGAAGKDGATPTFEVGTVTKLDPNAEPTVTLENVGGDLYMMDFGIPQGQPGTPGGGGGGNVTASGNNVFTGTNHFEGLTILEETHVPTAKDDNDATNKLYVDTLVSNTKKTTVDEVNAHTDERVNALRVLPAGGTSGQVPTIAPDGSTVEWKNPDTGGGGGGGVEWVEVALTNGANTAGEVHLFYDKADNTHLKMVGYFTSSSNLQAVSFTLPDANPIDYGHRVVAALPTSALNLRNSIYMTGVAFNGTTVTIESYTAMSSSYYRFVGTEFYVVTSAPQTDEGLPEPTDVPLPDPTLGE